MRNSFLPRKTTNLLLVASLLIGGLFAMTQDSLSGGADALMMSQAEAAEQKPISMKIKKVELDSPTLTLADSSKDEDADVQLAPNASVKLNGEVAQLSDLHPDDQIYVQRNSHGLITDIDAHRKFSGTVVSHTGDSFIVTPDYVKKLTFTTTQSSVFKEQDKAIDGSKFKAGDHVYVTANQAGEVISVELCNNSILSDLWTNFRKNLFKPLLLFFYLGFAITLLKVPFEFPQPLYQGLTMYLLVAIGWHGGEELAALRGSSLTQAALFMAIGFVTNLAIGFIAYFMLRSFVPKLRRIDAAAVAGHYGSDSAGTFVTALGVLQVAAIAFAAYMPVMLAVMEIPGCLVALFLAARLRANGMDAQGCTPDEKSWYQETTANLETQTISARSLHRAAAKLAVAKQAVSEQSVLIREEELVLSGHTNGRSGSYHGAGRLPVLNAEEPDFQPDFGELEPAHAGAAGAIGQRKSGPSSWLSGEAVREIFLNPGLFLLIGGIAIGYISRLQGPSITAPSDTLFIALFQGMLCLFLLEMGMTAAKRVRDLKTAGSRFVMFALITPNLFACVGIAVTSLFSHMTGVPFQLGTYVLFAVLCGSSSYIAVPAIQRLAIPEASPTLPLAASLGLTFTYNVTVGIPLYLAISEAVLRTFPVF